MSNSLTICIFLFGLLTNFSTLAQTSQELAGEITITHDTVMIQRSGTDMWLELSQDATAVFGEGDTLKTNDVSRALLNIDKLGTILLLPESEIVINQLNVFDEQFHISINGTGISIVDISSPNIQVQFELSMGGLNIQAESAHFIATSNSNSNAIGVHTGEVMVIQNQHATSITNGQVLIASSFMPTPQLGDFFFNTLLFNYHGCNGIVSNVTGSDINVRQAAFYESNQVGTLVNNTPVRIVGITEDQERLRIQYANQFGWVWAHSVQKDCTNLQILPDNTYETYLSIIAPQNLELTSLTPFFQTPDLDPLLYQ